MANRSFLNRAGVCAFVLATLLTAAIIYTGPAWADGPYRGRVIDAETKEPIEGAAVVAVWIREVWAGIQSNQHFAYAHEVLTDANGEFEMPGMPWTRHVTLFLNPFDWLDTGQPEFYILKPGYGWYPRYQVSPPWGSRQEMLEYIQGFALVELPKWEPLTNPKEKRRQRLPHCPVVGLSEEGELAPHIPTYIEYINQARIAFGYKDSKITCY